MRKRFSALAALCAFFTIIAMALALCSCVRLRDLPQVSPANSEERTEPSDPVVIETDSPCSSVTDEVGTDADGATEGEVEDDTAPVEVYFSISDIVENGRTLDLYGIEMTQSLVSLEETLNSFDGQISFVAYDIAGERAMAYNSAQTYCGHCTVKAGYMLYCCKKIESGEASADEMLTYCEHHYDSGAGNIKMTPFGSEYSIEKLIRLCLSVSDNTAYKMLVEHFGRSEYNDYIIGIGADSLALENWTIWANNTKPADLIKVWQEIYRYFEGGSDTSLMMKDACTGTPFNYITKGAPDIKYSHKSGEYFDYPRGFHDAAIIWNEKPYLICAMSDSKGELLQEVYDMIINTVNDIFSK